MTILIRKYYNQAVATELRRNWLQKEKLKKEQREESQRQNQDPNQDPNPNLNQNPNQDLKERKNLLVDMQLAFLEEQKLLKKFLVEGPSLQVK